MPPRVWAKGKCHPRWQLSGRVTGGALNSTSASGHFADAGDRQSVRYPTFHHSTLVTMIFIKSAFDQFLYIAGFTLFVIFKRDFNREECFCAGGGLQMSEASLTEHLINVDAADVGERKRLREMDEKFCERLARAIERGWERMPGPAR